MPLPDECLVSQVASRVAEPVIESRPVVFITAVVAEAELRTVLLQVLSTDTHVDGLQAELQV